MTYRCAYAVSRGGGLKATSRSGLYTLTGPSMTEYHNHIEKTPHIDPKLYDTTFEHSFEMMYLDAMSDVPRYRRRWIGGCSSVARPAGSAVDAGGAEDDEFGHVPPPPVGATGDAGDVGNQQDDPQGSDEMRSGTFHVWNAASSSIEVVTGMATVLKVCEENGTLRDDGDDGHTVDVETDPTIVLSGDLGNTLSQVGDKVDTVIPPECAPQEVGFKWGQGVGMLS